MEADRTDDEAAGSHRPDERDDVEVALSSAQIRKKAVAGVVLVGMRTFAIRAFGLVSSLVLARLLVPEDFGLLAVGQAIIMFGGFFADAGIAAGLIRRKEAPTRRELESILGFQMLVASVLVLAVAAVTVPMGRNGQVIALMAASVLLLTYRAPASLVLERRLDYGSLAAVEVLEGLVFGVWSVASVALGAGVWGVATAHLARGLIGTVLMIRRSPVRVFRLRFKLGPVRELLGYGLVVQAGYLLYLLRAQVITVATVTLAGLPVLGLYSLADRVIQVPWLVFESILRVTFPAMARLVSAGEDARSDLSRGLRLLVVTAGSLLALVAATAPVVIPFAFGARWTGAAEALPLMALGLLIAGPVVAVGNGYLYAIGDAKKILVANGANLAGWLVVAVPLLPGFGVLAVGAGLVAGFTVEGLLLARAVRQRTGLRCYRITAAPTITVLVAGAAGLQLALQLDATLGNVVLVVGTTTGLLAAGLLLTARATLREAVSLLRSLGDSRRRGRPA